MMKVITTLVAAHANLAGRCARLSSQCERREPQIQFFSNRMLDVTVALANAK